MTNGNKVINQALKYLGVSEVWGSNRGPDIDRWESRWNLKAEPWCGMFADAMFAEAGVGDSGLCHPSTAEMCRRAKEQDAYLKGAKAPAGSLWIKCGVHVALVMEDLGDGTVKTIEGNHNNRVAISRRRKSDGYIIVPPAVKEVEQPKYEYWLEDQAAKQSLFQINGNVGVWASKAARDKRLAQIAKSPEWRKQHPRPIVRKDKKGRTRYYIVLGPLRYYGPFTDKSARDSAKATIEGRLKRTLRAFRRKV